MVSPQRSSTLSALLALPALISAITLDCKNIVVETHKYDLGALGGPHRVHSIEEDPPKLTNHTYTIDICAPLKKTKGVPSGNECALGTRICGIDYEYNLSDNTSMVGSVFPVAGEYIHENLHLDPKWTRLKNSDSTADKNKDGLRLILNGGRHPWGSSKGKGTDQKAIIEFICDPARDGLEGDDPDKREKVEDNEQESRIRQRADDEQNDSDDSLRFMDYAEENGVGTLRLEWRTKYACESTQAAPSSSGHWGFFTWFIIIVFLVIAAYLIFGAWLNYNRYGARGWDLVPHGDSIRDLPYLLKDWGRRVVNSFQGGSSRGGYSAV